MLALQPTLPMLMIIVGAGIFIVGITQFATKSATSTERVLVIRDL